MNEYDVILYHVEQTIDRKLEDEEKEIFFEIFDKGILLGAKKMAEILQKEHSLELEKYGKQLEEITKSLQENTTSDLE